MSRISLLTGPSGPEAYRTTARWLALSIGLLIVWGSLYPLEFLMPTGAQVMEKLTHAGSHFISRTDLIANFLLYLPFGSACALAVGANDPTRRVAWATSLGSLLSLSMELTQLATPHRVTSIFDWSLNTSGTLIGAAAVALYLLIGVRWRFANLRAARPAVIPVSLLAVWFIGEFAPYLPVHNTLAFGKHWHTSWHIRHFFLAANWFEPLATWWIIAECVRHILRPRYAALCVAALIGLSVLDRLLLRAHTLGVEDAGSWCIVVAGALLTRGWPSRSRALITVACCLAAAAAGNAWLSFAGHRAGEFHWIPFSGSLLATRDYRPLLRALFLNGALLWSLTLVLRRLSWAFVLTFALTAAGEVAHLYTPPRRGEITDPLLVAVLAAAFAIARRFQVYAYGADGAPTDCALGDCIRNPPIDE